MHRVHAVGDNGALFDVNRGFSVRAASNGKRGVLCGDAEIYRYRGHQAEGCIWLEIASIDKCQIHTLVKNMAQIGNILQFRVGDLFRVLSVSEFGDNSLTKLVPHIGMTGQVEESRAEQAGSGVTASQQNVEHLVSEGLRIIGFSGQRVTEDVAVFPLFRVPLGLEGESHVVIDHLVDLLVGIAEFLGVDQPVEDLCSGPRGEPGL